MALVTAIDLGSHDIRTIQADISSGHVRIEGVGSAPSSGIQKGIIVGLEEVQRAIQESVERCQVKSGARITTAYASVSGKHISSRNSRVAMQVGGRDRLITDQVLRDIHKKALDIPLPEDREMLYDTPRLYFVDGVSGIKNPKGMSAFKLESEVHVVSGASQRLRDVEEVFKECGIRVEMVVDALAGALAVLDEEEKEEGVIFADIGAGTTDVAVFRDGRIWHTFVLPVGGAQLTRDLAAGLGIPLEVAEGLKKSHGNLDADAIPSEESAGMITVGVRDKYTVSYEDLCYIIQVRLEEILRMIMLGIPQPERGGAVAASLVLTGGTANLLGLEDFAQSVVGLPVRVGGARGVADMAGSAEAAELLADPAYSSAIGLLYWAAAGSDLMVSPSGPGVITRFGSWLRGVGGRMPKVSIQRPAGPGGSSSQPS